MDILKDYKVYRINNNKNYIPLYLFKSKKGINDLDLILSDSNNALFIKISILDDFESFLKLCEKCNIKIKLTDMKMKVIMVEKIKDAIRQNKDEHLDSLMKILESNTKQRKLNIDKYYSKIISANYYDKICKSFEQIAFNLSQTYIRRTSERHVVLSREERITSILMDGYSQYTTSHNIYKLSSLFHSLLIVLNESNVPKRKELENKLTLVFNKEFLNREPIKKISNYLMLLGECSNSNKYIKNRWEKIYNVLNDSLIIELFEYIGSCYPSLSYKK